MGLKPGKKSPEKEKIPNDAQIVQFFLILAGMTVMLLLLLKLLIVVPGSPTEWWEMATK